MFTKSQLVATAILVASASSVVASPTYSDVTEIEARNYKRDALAELKRRAILEYIEELEARELTGVTTGTVAAAVQAHNSKNSQQVSKPVSHQKDTQSTEGSHHGQNTQGHSLTQHRLSGHRLPGSRVKHKKSGQSDKESSSSTHRHNTRPGVSSASSSSLVKVKGPSGSASPQQINKRSVIEYLEDLFGRGPTETTTTSSATKGSQQPIPASNKGSHTSSSTNAPKGGEGHGQATKPSNAINEQKGTVARKSGTHKELEASTKVPSAHHQTQEHGSGKGTKHNVQHGNGLRKNKNNNRNRKQRVLSSSHERNSKKKGLKKEPAAHERHRGSSSHGSTLTTNGRVTTAGKQSTSSNGQQSTASSGQHSSSSNGQRISSNGKHTPPSDTVSSQQKPNLPPKLPSVKTREIEELAELIARELDLYDDLD